MSKKLIAGAGVVASFAVALAPLATFATDTTWTNESDKHTDTLKVTVAPACSFGTVSTTGEVTAGVTHTTGTANTAVDSSDPAAAWTSPDPTASDGLGRTPDIDDDGTNTTAHESISEFSYGIYAGTTKDAMATTTLTIFCNDTAGYTLKAFTNNLIEQDNGADAANPKNIPADTAYAADHSGYAISSVNVGSTGATTSYASTKFANSTTPTEIAKKTGVSAEETGDAITMTYGIGVAPSQKAALYKGNVVYTLFHGYNSGE